MLTTGNDAIDLTAFIVCIATLAIVHAVWEDRKRR